MKLGGEDARGRNRAEDQKIEHKNELVYDGRAGVCIVLSVLIIENDRILSKLVYNCLLKSFGCRVESGMLNELNDTDSILSIVVLILLIAILYWFFGTEMGCSIRATGINPKMSRAQGINTSLNTVLGIMISNGLVAFSGAFLAQYQGFADVKMGQGAIVIGLAAVIIGEALFSKIFKNFALRLLSVVLGSVIYYIVIQTVITLGLDANLLKLLSSAIVVIFLAIPHLKRTYADKHVRKIKGGKANA